MRSEIFKMENITSAPVLCNINLRASFVYMIYKQDVKNEPNFALPIGLFIYN